MAAETLTQVGRLMVLDTPLARDTLLVSSMTSVESMSGLFQHDIEMLAERANAAKIKPEDMLGHKFCVHLSVTNAYDSSPRRHFSGVVSRFVQGHAGRRFIHYRAEVVPWLWLLTRTHGCRIFQRLSVLEIVKKIFDELKAEHPDLVAYRDATTGTYTKLDYCVQYRETSFNFVSRLLEQDGIHYFFEHAESQHTLVLADAAVAHKPCPNQPTAVYVPEGGWGEFDNPVTGWEMKTELRPGKCVLRDYHMQLPLRTLEVTEPTRNKVGGNGNMVIYDYPGEYARRFVDETRQGEVEPEGSKLVRLRMEEQEVPQDDVFGTSLCRDFAPGFIFALSGHFNRKANAKYVLTSVRHSAVQTPWYVAEEAASGGEPYSNAFNCIPEKVNYRPARVTARPLVHGAQTATVVGKSGEEIWTDDFGRIKVQFHWDREGKADDDSSCWIRVASSWAGNQWGAVQIPRIGQEVVVGFLEGDPDQPIVIGSVYNSAAMPPYDLPGKQTQSGIKSRSSKGGGADNFNEIRMEDDKGKEELYVHAERQLTTVVKAAETRTVGEGRTTEIKKDDETTVKEGNVTLTVSKGDITIKAQLGTYQLDAKEVVVTGTTHVKLVCGGSTIEMTPASITINSPLIKLN